MKINNYISINNTLTLTPGIHKLTLKDNFEILQPFWEQLGSDASPNDRSCQDNTNSSLGVCLTTTDVLSISNEGSGVSKGRGTTVHTLPNPNPIERVFKVQTTCQVQITLSSQSKNIALESLELLRFNSFNLGYEQVLN